jgi:WD40 repeat protein
MLKRSLLFLVMFLLLAACTTPNQSIQSAPSPTLSPSATQTPLPSPTSTATQVPPTATLPPTPTATPTPLSFDLSGFRQFSILKDHFEGLANYAGERDYTVISACFSPTGNAFAFSACWGSMSSTGKCDSLDSGFLVVVDANTGEVISDIPMENSWPGNTAFSPDGTQLYVSTTYQKVFAWDLVANSLSHTFLEQAYNGRTQYPDVAAAPDGSAVAAVVNNILYVWDPAGKLLYQKPASQGTYNAGLNFSGDGKLLSIYAEDQSGVDVLNSADGSLVQRFPLESIGGIAISPDGRFLAGYNYYDFMVEVWNIPTGDKVAEITPETYTSSLAFSPKSDMLIISGISNQLETEDDYMKIADLYETSSWTRLDNLYSFFLEGRVKFSADGTKMAIFQSGLVSIWGEPDQKLLAGFDVLKNFQLALSQGKYEEAASMFALDEYNTEFLVGIGLDVNDIPGFFERMCAAQSLVCYPVKDLVMMGYDWDSLQYLVRIEDPSGGYLIGPKGGQIFQVTLGSDQNGNPVITWPLGSY